MVVSDRPVSDEERWAFLERRARQMGGDLEAARAIGPAVVRYAGNHGLLAELRVAVWSAFDEAQDRVDAACRRLWVARGLSEVEVEVRVGGRLRARGSARAELKRVLIG